MYVGTPSSDIMTKIFLQGLQEHFQGHSMGTTDVAEEKAEMDKEGRLLEKRNTQQWSGYQLVNVSEFFKTRNIFNHKCTNVYS